MSFDIKTNRLSTIKEQVYDIIKEQIINGSLKPGQWLQEKELAEKLRVSRSPVREALKELVGERLLENIPNKGVFVKVLSEKDIVEVYELRELLEKYSINKIVENWSPDIVAILDEIHGRLKGAFEREDVNLYSKIDAELHDAIVYLGGNMTAYRMMQNIFSQIQHLRTMSLIDPERFKMSWDEHSGIVEGIREKNFKKAWKWDKTHLVLAKEEILKQLRAGKL